MNPNTIVRSNTHVNGKYGVRATTSISYLPRSLGFTNRIAATRVNSCGSVHRCIAVDHNATSANAAHVNGHGLLVTCIRINRSYIINSGYIVTGHMSLTNRIRING